MSETVEVTRDGHVAILEFASPPNNFISLPLARELNAAIGEIEADKDVRAVVLASAGKVFCAGANLAGGDIPVGTQPNADGRDPFYVEAAKLFGAKKPVVAAVQGAAIGAGLGLALVADFASLRPRRALRLIS